MDLKVECFMHCPNCKYEKKFEWDKNSVLDELFWSSRDRNISVDIVIRPSDKKQYLILSAQTRELCPKHYDCLGLLNREIIIWGN